MDFIETIEKNLGIVSDKNFLPMQPGDVKETYADISESKKDLNFQRIDSQLFKKCTNVSIDIAVMEKTKLGMVFPMEVGWSDVGSWNSLWKESKKDKNGNSKFGNVILDKSENCFLIKKL